MPSVPMWFGLLRAIPVSGEVAQRELPVQTRLSKRAVRQPLHAPVNTLNANWAYMTMAALAWTLKAWSALLLPVTPRWAERHNEQRRRFLTMEFRTFRQAFIEIPCQIVTTGRRVRWRVLAHNQ
jgi:hypothetical protein